MIFFNKFFKAPEPKAAPKTGDWYSTAKDFRWSKTYNDLLTNDEMDEATAEVHRFIDLARPLTKDIYDEQIRQGWRKNYGTTVWVTVVGLKVMQNSGFSKFMDALSERMYAKAANRAREERKAAGWSGDDYLTSPTGTSKGPNGQRFGPFARPGVEYAIGKWDGVLKKSTRFTE